MILELFGQALDLPHLLLVPWVWLVTFGIQGGLYFFQEHVFCFVLSSSSRSAKKTKMVYIAFVVLGWSPHGCKKFKLLWKPIGIGRVA